MCRVPKADHNQRTVPGNPGRGVRSTGSWLFLLLAFSVFVWGTSYKLSLYKTNPPGSVTPAKLCKLTSDNAKSQCDQAVEGRKVAFSGFPTATVPAVGAFALVPQGQPTPRIETAGLAPLQAAPILHLRPPPPPDRRMFL